MADGAGKLDKLARLKNLKSGLKAKSEASGGDTDDLSLDADFGGKEAQVVAKPAAAPVNAAVSAPKPVEKDGESLSAYFEALGIVPDGAKLAGATGMPPKPYAPPSDAYTNSPDNTADEGREVDARDRWPDPVREDDVFLSSFAGTEKPEVVEEEEEELSLDSIIGSFDDDEEKNDTVIAEAAPLEVEEIVAVEEPAIEEMLADESPADELSEAELSVAELMAEEMAAELPKKPEAPSTDFAELELEPAFEPLGQEVDIEAFEREIGLSDPDPKSDDTVAEPESAASADTTATDKDSADQPLSITFDETRATLLSHVSKQMNCSIDDVVVTAIDWYLDALFGEDDPAMKADTAE